MLPIRSATINKLSALDQHLLIASTTTDFLTAASTMGTLGVGITAAAGTKTCPPIASHEAVYPSLFQPYLITVSSTKSGQFSRLLPSLDVGAISQAPSPESNSDFPLPVIVLVVLYTTNKLIGLRLILIS